MATMVLCVKGPEVINTAYDLNTLIIKKLLPIRVITLPKQSNTIKNIFKKD
jgi:hypothetical protein